jgi:lipoate synthase
MRARVRRTVHAHAAPYHYRTPSTLTATEPAAAAISTAAEEDTPQLGASSSYGGSLPCARVRIRSTATQTAVESFESTFFGVDEALRRATFQTDREVIAKAVELVRATYPEAREKQEPPPAEAGR